MDGGDIAVAQEHRYVHGGDVAVAPGTSLRPGAAAILGYVRAAKWTGYSTSGGEMDGGDIAVAQEHRYVRPRPQSWATSGGEMDGGDIAVAQEHRYVHGGDVAVAPGTSLRPGAAAILGYVRAAKWTGYSTSGGEMDGGDIAAAQEHRYVHGGDVAVAQEHRYVRPAAGSWATSGRRNGRRRCRRSPRNIATSGRGRNPGLRPGGEMDGGDIAAAQEHRPAGLRAMALRPAAMSP